MVSLPAPAWISVLEDVAVSTSLPAVGAGAGEPVPTPPVGGGVGGGGGETGGGGGGGGETGGGVTDDDRVKLATLTSARVMPFRTPASSAPPLLLALSAKTTTS